MSFKKIILSSLCIAGIGGISCAQLYASILSNQSLKPNVVYTKTDTSLQTSKNRNLEEVYKEQFLKVLKDYFDINLELDDSSTYSFYAELINEETLKQDEQEERQMLKQLLDQNQISTEEYNKYLARLKGRIQAGYERLALSKGDMVDCQLHHGDDSYFVTFDANTKEVLDAFFGSSKTSTVKASSKEEYSTFAIQYIKNHQLGGITSPELLMAYGYDNHHRIYQQKGDPSKKAVIDIDTSTHQIIGISTGNFAELTYQNEMSEK